jgi:uncharacterized membrane protein
MTTQHVRAALAVALLGLVTAMSPRPARADEVPKRLVYATYKNETSAMDVFNVLRDAERQNLIRIDSYAVVSKGLDGKVRVRDQRQKGTRAGAVVGGIVGLLGGPVGVVVGAAAGGVAGYLTGDAVGMSKEAVDSIKTSLKPGESAIIAIVDDKWAVTVQKMEEAKANRVTNESVPFVRESGAEGSPGGKTE